MTEQKRMVYVLDESNYRQIPFRASLYHLNMTKHAMHFWRIGETPGGHGRSLRNRAEHFYGCLFLSNTNTLMGIPRILLSKTDLDTEVASNASDRRLMLRTDQETISLTGFIICKFTTGSDGD